MADTAADAGPTGLGMMPSMSPECTPLKHRYDACFNRWFEDYLGVGGSVASNRRASGSGAPSMSSLSSSSSSSSSGGLGGLWSRSASKSAASPQTDAASGTGVAATDAQVDISGETLQRSPTDRKRLRERLDGECGAVWKEYQQCVLRSVKDKDLGGLIADARAHNPFPFPADTPHDRPNNEPFPFPAAPGGR